MKTTASYRQRHLSLVSQESTPAKPAPSNNLEVLAAFVMFEVRQGRTPHVTKDAAKALWACGFGKAASRAVTA